MWKPGHLKFGIPSSPPVMKRKSGSVQKCNAPSIPRRCASSRGNFSSSSSGSKRCGGLDLSESNKNKEGMRKKHKYITQVIVEAAKAEVDPDSIVLQTKKLTGHSFKSQFKRMRKVETVSEELAQGKSEKIMNFQGIDEPVHSASSKKMRHLKTKYFQHSEDINDSGRDLLLGEEDIDKETSNVDGGRLPVLSSNLKNVKNTIEGSSANEEHCEDQENVPLQQKLALEDNSVEICNFVNEIQKKCGKRMKKLIQKQEEQIQEFHRVWEDNISKLEMDNKLEAAIIRTIHGKCSTTTDKLKILDDKFAKKLAEKNLLKDTQLKDLEEEQLAARNEEIQKAASWLSDAKACIPSKLTGCCKEQSFDLQHEEVSRWSELRTHIPGAKDAMHLTEQHGENNDSSRTVKGNHVVQSNNSDRPTTEEVACDTPNGDPSSAINSSQKNEGEITFSDIPIPAVVEQINQPKHLGTRGSIFANLPASGEKVTGEMQSLELHGEVPSELLETVANEIVDDANPVNVSTNTSIEGFGEEDAIDLPDAENFVSGERIFPNLPASGGFPGEVQALELHGDVLVQLPETVSNEIVDNANPVDLSTNSPIEGFGKGDAIDSPDAEQLTQPKDFGCAERIFANLPASGERVPCDMQSLELRKGIPAELAETAHEIVDNVNPVELSANTSIKEFGEGDAIDLPDALVDQINETDGTNIDDLDLAGQVLKSSDQTKALQHPYPLLPLRVQEDQDVVSAEIQSHGVEEVGKVNSSPSEVVASELVDTARNSLSNTEPQAREAPAIETQISLRTEVSTSHIIDTVIADHSSMKLQDQDTSVVKDQVTSRIEVADSERVDTTAPVVTSELVGTTKTLQSNNELQDQVEPAIETQSTSRIEVAVSENLNNTSPVLSSTEQQDEDALIVKNQVNLEIEVSNSGLADNATPVQSHIHAPPIESGEQLQPMLIDASPSCNQLPSPELENQKYNLGRNSSGADETEILSHEFTCQLREDLEPQSNFLDVGPETQPSLATSVQISASFQNNVVTEAVLSTSEIPHEAVLQLGSVIHLPSDQISAWNSPSLIADPLQNELEKIYKETEELRKSHEDMVSGLKSECTKEIQKLVAEVRKKYQLKLQDAQAQFRLKSDGLNQNQKKILMNKLLADAFRFNYLNMKSAWPLMQQGSPSSSMQYHQHLVSPAGTTAPNPQIASLNGQAMQQLSVPNSTRLGAINSQCFAAPPAQAAAHLSAISRHWAINGVHPMNFPRFGIDIYSSAPHFQGSIPSASSPSMPNATLMSALQNLPPLHQPLAPMQWSSTSQNPQHLGYPPALMHASLSALGSLVDVEHHLQQLLGDVQGDRSTSAGATTAISLSDDD